MEGAGLRLKREREMVWFAAMLPHLSNPPSLKAFVGEVDIAQSRAERVRAFHSAWDKIDRALARTGG